MQVSDDLKGFCPRHAHFVGVDSDGCAFDSMRAKHVGAFIPAAAAVWDLGVHEEAFAQDEVAINLNSAHRGINRFAGLLLTFERFLQRPDVASAGLRLPDLNELRAFVTSGLKQSNNGLRDFARLRPSTTAREVLDWSQKADEAFESAAVSAPAFGGVREALAKASSVADVMIVSAATSAGLRRDWERGGLLSFTALVAGQEVGDKATQLRLATRARYRRGNILLIGDSPGDLDAARSTGALFYPIVPGKEEACWRRFHAEVLDQFIAGTYAGASEYDAVSSFRRALCMD